MGLFSTESESSPGGGVSQSAPILLALAGLGATGYAAWLGHGTTTCLDTRATMALGGLGVLTLLAIIGAKAQIQRGLAATFFGIMAVMGVAKLAGTQLFSTEFFGDPRYAVFITGLLVLNIVGLIRGVFLARWLSFALAVGGVASGGLNLLGVGRIQSSYSWSLAIGVAGSLFILANLAGRAQREFFEQGTSPLWSSDEPLLRSIRHTIIAFMVAIPMLLVYTWIQPIVPETASTALPLAIFLVASILASVKRWVLGAVGLVLGGAALLLQAGATFYLASETG